MGGATAPANRSGPSSMVRAPIRVEAYEAGGQPFDQSSGAEQPAPPAAATKSSTAGAQQGPNLLSSVVHELRAPLAALTASAELLAEDCEGLDRTEIRGMASTI